MTADEKPGAVNWQDAAAGGLQSVPSKSFSKVQASSLAN